MKSRREIEARLEQVFQGRDDVAAVYLFGSVARESARSTSDVDVGVLLRAEPPPTLEGLRLGLEAEIEACLGLPVQLVILNTAACDLAHRVLRDGRLILDRDRSARIRFEVRTRNDFFDLQPFVDRYRRTAREAPLP